MMDYAGVNRLIDALASTTTSLHHISGKVGELNESVNKSSDASSKLTKKLNDISWWGIGVAIVGVSVAAGHL